MAFHTSYKVEDGRTLHAKFESRDNRDGFEISLGMYKANLGPITEAVFAQYVERFAGEWSESDDREPEGESSQ
ncbi:hypothetical protein [Tumebacillus flagellatus]|uniref:Uncharacterized protein n=1 Tax=Tumebacillus flagellatus TaxID=1157490 RepID=A0A074MCD6_9BACL|nr:hypothetical protein [Tumebacillus flagellatus]KEO83547.1 hypothetical protein EL26_09025 [Tumebacillus flagellatus]